MAIWARRRAAHVEVSDELRRAAPAFRSTVEAVEGAKAALASAAPRGRSVGTPLAEALAGFEDGVRRARSLLPSWRVPEVAGEWEECRGALEQSADRAERLRLEKTPDGYEELYRELGDIIEPLDAFAGALGAFSRLGL